MNIQKCVNCLTRPVLHNKRNKKVFPNDESALKSIYLAFLQIEKKWKKSRSGWGQIYNQLFINFEERIEPKK